MKIGGTLSRLWSLAVTAVLGGSASPEKIPNSQLGRVESRHARLVARETNPKEPHFLNQRQRRKRARQTGRY